MGAGGGAGGAPGGMGMMLPLLMRGGMKLDGPMGMMLMMSMMQQGGGAGGMGSMMPMIMMMMKGGMDPQMMMPLMMMMVRHNNCFGFRTKYSSLFWTLVFSLSIITICSCSFRFPFLVLFPPPNYPT